MSKLAAFISVLGVGHGFVVPRQSSRLNSLAMPLATQTLQVGSRSSSRLFVSVNEDLKPGIAAIDAANDKISEELAILRNSPYFRLYPVDILASCEYMPQELFECYSETCEIYPIDDDEIPEVIRAVDFDESEFEMDGWARWDMPSNDYYDTEQFPEGYTGYDGSDIWTFIHEKICFDGYDYDDDHWKADFNKAVSGLHSMVSSQIVRGIRERVEDGEDFKDEEVWRDPKVEFDRRLGPKGETPMAIENLYFGYMLFLSAASKAKERLLEDCAAGKFDEEAEAELKAFLNLPVLQDSSVEVAAKKFKDHALKDSGTRNSMWEVRLRSRELLRIINCVQCNKCRLHGKIAMMGLSTALQIHLGRSGDGGDPNRIHRVELAALISTLYKFSRAIKFYQENK